MSTAWAVSVVIPARNEAATIHACIRSVLAAGRHARQRLDVTIVADRCLDDTAAIAAEVVAGSGRVVEIDAACVGTGRRIGTARSLAMFAAEGHLPEQTWLLATDADSVVPLAWISAHLRLAAAGAHGVAGVVVVDSFDEHPARVEAAFRHRYRIGLSGEHAHVHGTNLGVRADAYAGAGGWQDVATGEDHDLWCRLKASGVPLVSTVDAPVRTSGRAAGRAPEGFATLLRSLAVPGGSDDLAR